MRRGTRFLPSPGFPSQQPFREASLAQRRCFRAPRCTPPRATPGEAFAEGTISVLGAPSHPVAPVRPGSPCRIPSQHAWPPQPVPKPIDFIHSLTFSASVHLMPRPHVRFCVKCWETAGVKIVTLALTGWRRGWTDGYEADPWKLA